MQKFVHAFLKWAPVAIGSGAVAVAAVWTEAKNWIAIQAAWGWREMSNPWIAVFVILLILAYASAIIWTGREMAITIADHAPTSDVVKAPSPKSLREAEAAAELARNRPRKDHLLNLCAETEKLESSLDEIWSAVPARLALVVQPGQRPGMDGDPFYRINIWLEEVRRYLTKVKCDTSIELPVTFNPGIAVAGEELAANEGRKYAYRQLACQYRLAKAALASLRQTWASEIEALDARWQSSGR